MKTLTRIRLRRAAQVTLGLCMGGWLALKLVPIPAALERPAAGSTEFVDREGRTLRETRMGEHFAKSVTFAAPFSGDWEGTTAPTFEVDLHRTLAPGPFGARVPLEDLHRGAIPVRIERRWYRALHPTHRFVHQCLHAVLGSPVPRLHSLRDLVLSAPRTPDEVTHTVEVARAWRVAAVVDAAVRMGEARFPGAFLVDLVDAVQAERVPARDRLLIASYNRGSSSYALPAVLTVPELPSWRDRWDFLIAHVAHRVRSRAAAPGSRIS